MEIRTGKRSGPFIIIGNYIKIERKLGSNYSQMSVVKPLLLEDQDDFQKEFNQFRHYQMLINKTPPRLKIVTVESATFDMFTIGNEVVVVIPENVTYLLLNEE